MMLLQRLVNKYKIIQMLAQNTIKTNTVNQSFPVCVFMQFHNQNLIDSSNRWLVFAYKRGATIAPILHMNQNPFRPLLNYKFSTSHRAIQSIERFVQRAKQVVADNIYVCRTVSSGDFSHSFTLFRLIIQPTSPVNVFVKEQLPKIILILVDSE